MELKFKTFDEENDWEAFKSHLYGIEMLQFIVIRHTYKRLNRTFMELKFARWNTCSLAVRLNRTFMELKLSYSRPS